MDKLLKSSYKTAVMQAILAAALFGMSAPFSKFILSTIPPLMLSALLYLGAGLGMLLINIAKQAAGIKHLEARISKNELVYVILMVLLDIAAPISLMFGLTMTSAENASLLSNFEIVTTALIALVVFKEAVGKRLWLSILLITASSIILTVNNFVDLTLDIGSLFILLACLCWGLENNCTRKLSIKDPSQVVIIKGIGAGFAALVVAFAAHEVLWNLKFIMLSLLLGFFAYGMSILFYVKAQRHLGAARTSAYYAVAPFIGVGISFLMFKDSLTLSFFFALLIMLIGTYFAVVEKHQHEHMHSTIQHEHRHNHNDGHHTHVHNETVAGEHTHVHIHEQLIHAHEHRPDIHHTHAH